MRKIIFGLGILSMGIITSCKGDSSSSTGKIKVEYSDEEEELYNFEGFNLTKYDLPFMIYLPDATASIGTAMDPEVLHQENGFTWDLIVGPNFHITIEDWGDEPFSEHVKAIENNSIYDVEFLEKSDNFVYYKATLKVRGKSDDKNVGTNHESYHVAAQHTINGINYLVKSNKDGHAKNITDYMAKSVQSVKEINNN